jgi:hypothetical protein
MQAIHLICRRDIDGVSLNHLSFDNEAQLHRSGRWDLPQADAQALVGGWLYLHPSKSVPSEYGGIIVGYECLTDPTLGHPHRIIFLVRRRRDGNGQKWRGNSYSMAYSSGLVPASYTHEQIEAGLGAKLPAPMPLTTRPQAH